MATKEQAMYHLGMPIGTATARLRKTLMFHLVKKLSLNVCYRCGIKIRNEKDLSIEHKTPWLYSENPTELFFNLENITFSHLRCNTLASRRELRKNKIGETGEKYIRYRTDKFYNKPFRVIVRIKKASVSLGQYATIDEAMRARDKYLYSIGEPLT